MKDQLGGWTKWLRKGSGDAVALAFVLPFALICILYIAALMQYAYAVGNLNRAAAVGARAAALCADAESAAARAGEVANACISNTSVSNVEASIDVGGDGWRPGATAVLVIRADIRTLEPFFLSGAVEHRAVFTVESDGAAPSGGAP